MFFKPRATIDDNDLEWQQECWLWLLENFGGQEAMRAHRTVTPSSADFPRSGKTGCDHARHVFNQVAAYFKVDPAGFDLIEQEEDIDPMVAPLAVVHNAPVSPLGTYSADGNRHLITYSPANLRDLEGLIATFAHEICHPLLFSIATAPPGGDEAEEFATDLAMVFFGFGIFGGNQSFQFMQYRDDATGTQGWSTRRAGYLSQNEWGFALAVRALLLEEDVDDILGHCADGLAAHVKKNVRYLAKTPGYLEALVKAP